MSEIKTPVVHRDRWHLYAADDEHIACFGKEEYAAQVAAAINEAAALRERVTNPMVCRLGCGLVDDECDAAGHPMRPLKEVLKENQALREQVAELDSELRQYKMLFNHAIECVDRVFQVEARKPAPLLPDFLKLGECKFEGVERLAVAYLSLQSIIASTPSARDLQNSTLGQLLTRRNAELERENAALREAAKAAKELITSLPYRKGCGGDVELMIEQLTTAIGAKP